MLEVIQKLGYLKIKSIKKLDTKFETYFIKLEQNIDLLLNCCGKNIRVIELNFFFKNDYFKINFDDNFNSFKNTLEAFYDLISKKKQHVKYSDTKLIINSILAILKA